MVLPTREARADPALPDYEASFLQAKGHCWKMSFPPPFLSRVLKDSLLRKG